MTLQQIKYFLEVAHTLNFTAAAKKLYVAQSSMSYAIHELEHELGVPLFVRNANKKVALTDYGEKYLPYAEQMLTLLEEGEQEIKRMKNPLSGTVNIGFYYCVVNDTIPWLFSKFYEDNPNTDIYLNLKLSTNAELRIEEELMLGRYDFIVCASSKIKDCVCQKIGAQDTKLLLSKSHHLANRTSVKPEELDGEPVIGLSPSSNLDNFVRDMYKKCNMTPDITYSEDWMQQQLYVALNYGIAIAPSLPLCTDYVTEIDLDYPTERDLYLVWSKTRKLSKAAEYVKDYIIQLSKDMPLFA